MGKLTVTKLVLEEIERAVADAAADDGVLWASTAARRIKDDHPGCALTEQQIEGVIIRAAAKSSVPVQLGHDWHDVPYSALTGVRL